MVTKCYKTKYYKTKYKYYKLILHVDTPVQNRIS